jgi:hypothetical protein
MKNLKKGGVRGIFPLSCFPPRERDGVILIRRCKRIREQRAQEDYNRALFAFFLLENLQNKGGLWNLPDNDRGRIIKRVLPHREVEEIRVMLFYVIHILQPLGNELRVHPLHITLQVGNVRRRQ